MKQGTSLGISRQSSELDVTVRFPPATTNSGPAAIGHSKAFTRLFSLHPKLPFGACLFELFSWSGAYFLTWIN
jgi:hypothetical protein